MILLFDCDQRILLMSHLVSDLFPFNYNSLVIVLNKYSPLFLNLSTKGTIKQLTYTPSKNSQINRALLKHHYGMFLESRSLIFDNKFYCIYLTPFQLLFPVPQLIKFIHGCIEPRIILLADYGAVWFLPKFPTYSCYDMSRLLFSSLTLHLVKNLYETENYT